MTKKCSSSKTSLANSRLKPLVVALICAGFGNIAMAQTPPQGTDATEKESEETKHLDTVEVKGEFINREMSSNKFTAPVLDMPQSLQTISSDVFKQQGAQNLTDVLSNTPSISFNAGENGFSTSNNNFSIRGFESSGSIFMDGARDAGSYSRDVFNTDQVEVAKGPTADNGRGGPGGYVNIVTKSPQATNFANATVSYGFDEYDSDARQRAVADINQTIGDGGIAVRMNLLYEDSGIAGREWVNSNTFGLAPSVAFGLNSPTRVILSWQHTTQDELPDWGVPAAMIDGMMRFDVNAAKADRDNFYGLISDFDDTTADSLLARIEHRFNNGSILSNQTRLGETERTSRFTVVTGYTPATELVATQTQIYDRDTKSLSNLTNFSTQFSTGSMSHSVATGLELTREQSDARRYGTNIPPATNIFSPDPFRGIEFALNPQQTNDVEVDTVALYLNDTISFNEHWELTGGLRVENYDVSIDSKTFSGDPQGALDGYTDDETTVGGKLGLVYKPVENGSIYAAVGKSSLPAGSYLSNPDISRTGDNAFPGFVPGAKVQESTSWEVGSKWNFLDDRLNATIAFFDTEKDNVPIVGRQAGDTVDSLQGYGKQVVHGIEVTVSGQITDAWMVFGGFAILDSERKHSLAMDEARCRANPTDYLAGATANDCPTLVAGPLGTNGDQLAFTPEQTGSLWTTYDFGFGLTVGGGIQYVGDSYAGRPDDATRFIPNGNFGKLPSYTVANLLASYRLNNSITLRLNVDNLTDELYATSSNWPAQRVALGSSRAYLISADLTF